MYLHGLLRAVEAAPAFHQPYHLHCTDKAGFPGAFYNILLPCGQLVPKIQKIQKRAIPTKGRHIWAYRYFTPYGRENQILDTINPIY